MTCSSIIDLSALSRVWQGVELLDDSLGTCPRYSLVADEDVKKTNKQSNKHSNNY